MAVNIVQKEIKFFSELVNGSNFDQNLTSYTTTFADAPTGRCKAVSTIEVTVGMNITNFQILYEGSGTPSATNPNYKIVKDDATFLSEGFTVGSEIALTFKEFVLNTTYLNCYLTVDAITDTELIVTYNGKGADDNSDISLLTLFGSVNNSGEPRYITDGYIAIEPSFTALEYSYNLIENSSSNASLISPLTNTVNVIKVKDIPTAPSATVRNGTVTSKNKAASMGGVTVEFKDTVYNNNAFLQIRFSNQYEITHEFTVPYYFDGEDDNLADTTTPPDLYIGTSSPKYIYQTTWYTDINDPNTGSTTVYDDSIGNSGYLDEAFNGDENPYTVSNLVYENITTGNSTDRLSVGDVTRVTFDVDNSFSDFTNTQNAVVAHGSIVDSSVYESSTNNFDTVWTFETAKATAGGGLVTNGAIKDFSITYNNTGSISVQFDIEFSGAEVSVLEENQYYLLAIQLRNDNESIVAESHKVHLKIDYNQYGKNSDIEGLFDAEILEQYPHPYVFDEGVTTGFTNAKGFNETGYMLNSSFWVLNEANLDSLKFSVVIFNTTNNTWVSLRDLNIDLSDSVEVQGIQQIELDSTRGYVLEEDDIFNYLKLGTRTNDGTKQYYSLQVGYKIPWQSWNELPNAPTDFYDKTKSFNGLNQKTSNYSNVSGLEDYEIKVLLDANVESTGIVTNYVKTSEKIDVFDYDTDDLDPDGYTCEINTYNEDGTEIDGNIIKEEFTELRAIFTPINPPVFTESVDFTEVASSWGRFAHGNLLLPPASISPRLGVWENEQANDTDTFDDIGGSPHTKGEAGLYTSTTNSIQTNQNCNAFYGCYSIEEYEFYSINGKMFSNASDNDALCYNLAFHIDEEGKEHTLSLCATTGGVLLDLNPGATEGNDQINTIGFVNTVANWALVYNFGKLDCVRLDFHATTESGYNWSSGAVGDLMFGVSRSANDLTVDVDWTINATPFSSTFNYDLNSNEFTKKFIGVQRIGFSFMSQDQGGFKDVELTKPTGDYYGILRLDEENAPTDSSVNELSTEIEAPENNLLTQITGTEKKALLSYDGTSFIVQGKVDTDKINLSENYRFSAELRTKDLLE